MGKDALVLHFMKPMRQFIRIGVAFLLVASSLCEK